MAKRIDIVGPDGDLYDVEEHELQAALAQGYRVPTAQDLADAENKKRFDDPVMGAALGAARGLTFGLSDVALAGTGLVPGAQLGQYEQQNPKASVAGEVGGTLATALIPGGQGKVAVTAPQIAGKVGLAAERAVLAKTGLAAESLAGKVVGKAVSGATEGALMGAGQAVSDTVMSDGELNAERFLATVGANTILGGGLGGMFGAVQRGGSKLLGRAGAEAVEETAEETVQETAEAAAKRKLDYETALNDGFPPPKPPPSAADDAAKAADEPIDEFAARATKELEETVAKEAPLIKKVMTAVLGDFPTPEELVLRDLGFKKAAVKQLRRKDMLEDAPRELLDDPRYAKAKTADQKIELLRTKREEELQKMLGAEKKFDEAAQPEELISTLKVAETIDQQLIAPLREAPSVNRTAIKQLEDWMDDLLGRGEYLTMREAEKFKRQLDPHLRWDSSTENVARDKLKQLRGILNGEIEATAAKISNRAFAGPKAFDEWKKAKRAFGGITELLGEGEERLIDAKMANRVFGLTDNIVGAASGAAGFMTMGPGGIAMAAGGALLNKWGRERLPHILAVTFHQLRNNKGVAGAATRLQKMVQSAPEGTFGAYDEKLRAAAKAGPDELAGVHMALSQQDEAYKAVADREGLHSFTEAVVTGGKSHEVWQRIQDALDGLGSDTARRAVQVTASNVLAQPYLPKVADSDDDDEKDRRKQLAKRSDELSALMSNPETLVAHMQEAVRGQPPDVAAAISERMTRAIAFLSEKAPKRPPTGLFPALERPWLPSDAEVSAFERYAAVVNDPLSVLDGLTQGRVTREAVEALQRVYPKLYEELRTAVAERLGDGSLKIGYNQRLSLALLFDAPVDPALEPSMFQMLQAAHQRTGGNGPSGPPPSRGKYDGNRGLASWSERLASRG